MTIYILLFLLLLVTSNSRSRVVYVFACVLLFLVLGLRGENIGTDTKTYNHLFTSMEGKFSYMEIGWECLRVFVWNLGVSATVFNLIVAAISLLSISFVVTRETENSTGALLVYYSMNFYFFSFNGMRQSLAICIAFVAIYYYVHEKKRNAMMMIGLATCFHSSAITVSLIFLLDYIRLSQSRVYFFLLMSTAVGILIPLDLLQMVSGGYSYILEHYVRQSQMSMIVYMIYTNVLFIYVWEKVHNLELNEKWLNVYFFSVILFNVFIQSSLAIRITYFFSISQIIILPQLWKNNLSNKIVIMLFCMSFFCKDVISEYSKWGEEGNLMPYVISEEIFK